MADPTNDKRMHHRCCKDVGMHCALLHGSVQQWVTLRNFSSRGIYFESPREFLPGSFIVLRTMAAGEWTGVDAPGYALAQDDPESCARFRSHVVARVQRCEQLDGPDRATHYGVGAEIQILTD